MRESRMDLQDLLNQLSYESELFTINSFLIILSMYIVQDIRPLISHDFFIRIKSQEQKLSDFSHVNVIDKAQRVRGFVYFHFFIRVRFFLTSSLAFYFSLRWSF